MEEYVKRLIAVTFVAVLASVGVARAETPAEDFTKAEQLNEAGHKAYEASIASAKKSVDESLDAAKDWAEARVLEARALALEKADAKKIEAAKLRWEVRRLWREEHRLLVRAAQLHRDAEWRQHRAAEDQKAANDVKDQPAIAKALSEDAKKEHEVAQKDEAASKKDHDAAVAIQKKRNEMWSKANQLDPRTAQVAKSR
jgi:hypothetical protein